MLETWALLSSEIVVREITSLLWEARDKGDIPQALLSSQECPWLIIPKSSQFYHYAVFSWNPLHKSYVIVSCKRSVQEMIQQQNSLR